MRILFQGDSITDAGRDRRNFHDLGKGYPSYAAKYITENHPSLDLEFINLGISGNRSCQLFDRIYPDAISLEPDIISILIGINDIWHRYSNHIMTSDAQFELNYRTMLTEIRKNTTAKIMIISPFLLDASANLHLRPDLERIKPIVKKLADEFSDVFIPLDEYFIEALKTQPESCYYSADGVHPNDRGAEFIGRIYADAIKSIL